MLGAKPQTTSCLLGRARRGRGTQGQLLDTGSWEAVRPPSVLFTAERSCYFKELMEGRVRNATPEGAGRRWVRWRGSQPQPCSKCRFQGPLLFRLRRPANDSGDYE